VEETDNEFNIERVNVHTHSVLKAFIKFGMHPTKV